jgi:hypothetical protein
VADDPTDVDNIPEGLMGLKIEGQARSNGGVQQISAVGMNDSSRFTDTASGKESE